MWAWFKAATARASRSDRSENFSFETLMATMRSRRESRALYTSPMPPAPMGARISYGPNRVPAERGMVVNDSTVLGPRPTPSALEAVQVFFMDRPHDTQ